MATVHEFTHALDWTLTTDRGKIERNTISNVGTSLASPAYVVNFNGELLYTILISPKDATQRFEYKMTRDVKHSKILCRAR